MKFELTYSDASKVTIEVPNPVILAWLDNHAKAQAADTAAKAEQGRGTVVTAKVV